MPLTASRHSEAVSEKPDDLSDDPSTRALASLASAELDIDREIDTLFVPADPTPPVTFEEVMTPGKPHGLSDGSAAILPDLASAESEIDREIDTLFIPSGPKALETYQPPEVMPEKPHADPDPSANPFSTLAYVEDQIDREIDSIFVPEQKTNAASPDWEASDASFSTPEAQFRPGFDLDSFESLIDREIDSMFVPKTEGPAIAAPSGRHETFAPDLPGQDVLRLRADLHVPASKPSDAPVPEVKMEEFPLPAPGLPSQHPSTTRIAKLVESFNAAYLSFDWECSSENARTLQTALCEPRAFF